MSSGSLGNEAMVKVVAGECSYVQVCRWGMKVCSRVSLGNEGMFKGVAGEGNMVKVVGGE